MTQHLIWNPDRVAFYIPFLNHPVVWYGVLFALGFLAAYALGLYIFLNESFAQAKLSKDDILDWERLKRDCQKYPKLFDHKNLSEESILNDLHQSIRTKKLPLNFYKAHLFKIRDQVMQLADRLTTHIVLGLLIGARLGYIFFYGWPAFKAHPLDIFKIWEGGLASHGACIGIIVSLLWFKFNKVWGRINYSFWHIMDLLALICGPLAFFIRLGNFVNQEIVGKAANMPWAIIFVNPLGGESPGIARHPVQLYEAFFYLFLGFCVFLVWKKNIVQLGTGMMTGLLLTPLFVFRFFIEFLKEHQGSVIGPDSLLQMGQLLSLPFVCLGLWLVLRPLWAKKSLKRPLFRESLK